MQKYFDIWEYEEIKKVMDYDMVTAKNKCEIYMQKYPEDHFARLLYANILITVGDIAFAKEIIESSLENAYNDSSFLIEKIKIEGLIDNIKLYKLRILGFESKYEDAYEFLMNNKRLIKKFDLYGFVSFLNFYLGKINVKDRSALTYAFRQSYEYQNDDFLDHVSKHLYKENANLSDAVFAENFPFNEILNEVEKSFDKNKRLFYGLWTDKYIFKFNDCGIANGKYVDYFEVVCIHDTFNIITMYPMDENKNFSCADLNYLQQGKGNSRKLSQIDKFNMRYKR